MITFNIYALIDSRDNSVFYIGATKRTLAERLSGHKGSTEKYKAKSSIVNKRARRIKDILSSGGDIHIKLLKKCTPEHVDRLEEKYYNIYVKNGFDLIQNKSHFNMSQKRWLDVEMIRFATKIDVDTHKRFDEFCDSIRLQPSTALRILLNEALNAREAKNNK